MAGISRIADAVGAAFGHVILGLPAPYPVGVARWIADELIALRATAWRSVRPSLVRRREHGERPR